MFRRKRLKKNGKWEKNHALIPLLFSMYWFCVCFRAESVPVCVNTRRPVQMHRMWKNGSDENIQKQVQLPATRVPLPRGPSTESIPMSGVSQRIFTAGQNEKPHENGPRVLCTEGLLPGQPDRPRGLLYAAAGSASPAGQAKSKTSARAGCIHITSLIINHHFSLTPLKQKKQHRCY